MKTLLYFAAVLATTVATSHEIDWSIITPKNIYVEPVGQPELTPGNNVIGGHIAPLNAFPYQVGLIIDGSSFCGGSVISRDFILTAAHCTDGAGSAQVILGSNRINSNDGHQVIKTTNIIINHESWNSPVLYADIALLRLRNPIELNHAIQIIQLAPADAPDYAGARVRLSGWGRTSDASQSIASQLKYVDLSVITNTRCKLRFLTLVRDSNICTSGEGVVGACNGDSGGPLVNGHLQVGIVSFGSSSCEAGAPTVFTRVSSFRSWIATHSNV